MPRMGFKNTKNGVQIGGENEEIGGEKRGFIKKDLDPINKKARKGEVSVSPYRDGYRVRWRIQGPTNNNRRTLNISAKKIQGKEMVANMICAIIQRELSTPVYDDTLVRYNTLIRNPFALIRIFKEGETGGLQESKMPGPPKTIDLRTTNDQSNPHSAPVTFQSTSLNFTNATQSEVIDIPNEFERYLKVRLKLVAGREEELHSYYRQTWAMVKRWGVIDIEDVPIKLGGEKIGAATFNDRRNCLHRFFEWMVAKRRATHNPLAFVDNMKRPKHPIKREPLSPAEYDAILAAFKNNTFVSKDARKGFDHNVYYPFVYVLFNIGCRPAEAIGLQVKDVLWDERKIYIGKAFARSKKGRSNIGARIMKSTKNGKVRYFPISNDMELLLKKVSAGKQPDDFLLTNMNGNPIDDHSFKQRIWDKVLKSLKISERDLYACRHTWATRAVLSKTLSPAEIAYLMGDNLQTVLDHYYDERKQREQNIVLPDFYNVKI